MKIAIMGDSISQGIGSKKINYAKILEKDYQVNNFALTGTTTKYALDIIEDVIDYNPNLVILFYGNVDALPRVKSNTWVYKNIIPKRYKGLGMFDPRALYTSKLYKKIFQIIDSQFRYRLKNLLIKLQGYEQWVKIDEFKINYDEILNKLISNDIKVITISNVPIDENYFNNANKEYKKYNTIIKDLSNKYNCNFINLDLDLDKNNLKNIFLKDLYHPNQLGYEIISDLINREIKNMNIID